MTAHNDDDRGDVSSARDSWLRTRRPKGSRGWLAPTLLASSFLLALGAILWFTTRWRSAGDRDSVAWGIALFALIGTGLGMVWAVIRQRTEISNRLRAEQRLERNALEARLLHRATALAAETAHFEDALQRCLDMICETTGWPLGHVFQVVDGIEELQTSGIWHADFPDHSAGFRAVTERSAFPPGVGLPGRILVTGEPAWIVNVQLDENSPRRTICREIGIRGAFGFPIKIGPEVIAVMELFHTDEISPDDELLALMGSIGEQLGRVIERRKAQIALSQSELTAATRASQLAAVNDAMTVFLETGDWHAATAGILRHALEQTQSEYGFIGVTMDDTLRVFAHEGVRWAEFVGRDVYEEALRTYADRGFLEFDNMQTLFGAVITGGRAVVANDPAAHPAAARNLPTGHPPLDSFLGVPIVRGTDVVGMIGTANRPGGFSEHEQDKLEILSRAAGVLFESYRQRQRQELLEKESRQSALALEESEERFQLAETALDGGVWDWNVRTGDVYFSPSWKRMLGYEPDELEGRVSTWEEMIHPSDWDTVRTELEKHFEGKTAGYRSEYRMRKRDGSWIWVLDRGRVVSRDDAGNPLRMAGTDINVSERRRVDESLKISEERFDIAVRGSSDGLWDRPDLEQDQEWWSPRFYELLGYAPGEIEACYSALLDALHPDDLERATAAVKAHLEQDVPFDVEYRLRTKSGEFRWFRGRARALKDKAGRPIRMAGSIQDINGRKRAEQHQAMMMDELDHRVKNNLAGVIALARQTISAADTMEEFEETFTGRIMAMARAHEGLAATRWLGLDLMELVERLFAPVDEKRWRIQGERIVLPARVSGPLTSTLHELTTNALKYGALSRDVGLVDVRWEITTDGQLVLTWTERGGTFVTAPGSPGLGLTLIRGFIENELGGAVEHEFPSSGVTCRLAIPLIDGMEPSEGLTARDSELKGQQAGKPLEIT